MTAIEERLLQHCDDSFLKSKDKNNLHNILIYLKKWSDNDAEFEKINQNPITNSLASLSNSAISLYLSVFLAQSP